MALTPLNLTGSALSNQFRVAMLSPKPRSVTLMSGANDLIPPSVIPSLRPRIDGALSTVSVHAACARAAVARHARQAADRRSLVKLIVSPFGSEPENILPKIARRAARKVRRLFRRALKTDRRMRRAA